MNPISIALKGKGLTNFLLRGKSIVTRYGITANSMNQVLALLAGLLAQFECGGTFPITAVALKRNPQLIKKYQTQGLEFAIHGYRHLDHSHLSQAEQMEQLTLARQVFARAGIQAKGFRGPYLRWNVDILAVLTQQGLVYDSSQGLAWEVLNGLETQDYRHVLDFYRALPAKDYPSLPSLEKNLVRIPYSLPDDEALVERLGSKITERTKNELWLAVLQQTYKLGELFTLGIHPERTNLCYEALKAVLTEAHQLTPAVWIARLDEIARWWQARAAADITITDLDPGEIRLNINGPEGTIVLARAVEINAATTFWIDDIQQTKSMDFTLRSPIRPWIGVSPNVAPALTSFLRQQGYILETSRDRRRYSYYFDQTEFAAENQRPLLAQIEADSQPLVRLGRWPKGSRSALAITGDIDAITLWDYGLRLLGR
jgi:peptidoglycan/xylan/chitin deacetylase (PgdA/CDA1 family)